MIEIKPYNIGTCSLSMPGSKSYSHRALISASLSNKPCRVFGILRSHDIKMTYSALKKIGVSIYDNGKYILINGNGGNFKSYNSPIYLGDSGTSMRLLTGLMSLGKGTYTLIGSERMQYRPIAHLIDAMNKLGFSIRYLYNYGFPPIEIQCSKKIANYIEIDCSISSQYLSALLMISPCFRDGLEISVSTKIVSRPYIDITIDIMEKFGIVIEKNQYTSFYIPGSQTYSSSIYKIEPDCSHACYFWAAAAITGGSVTVEGLNLDSKQGDIKFLNVLKKMGCTIHSNKFGITVLGGCLKGIKVDMSDMPDVVPTLSVVALFAEGTTEIDGISHLRLKESDRINAIIKGCGRMGILAQSDNQKLIIKGGNPKGAVIKTYNDHRIAMSFALAGLKINGIKIKGESCVVKSFPNFWDKFKMMYNS